MNLKECITTRRSIRRFTEEPVDPKLLTEIINLTACAPSWKNTQIPRYTAITDRQVLDLIAEKYASFNASRIKSAPVLLVQSCIKGQCGYERNGSFTTDRGDAWQMYDCGISAQTLSLAAHDLGLGTVIMGIFERKPLEEFIDLPENEEITALIALGHPAIDPPAPPKKGADEILRFFTGSDASK